MLPIDPDKFDLEGLDKAALAYKKKERVSQRGEARKLLPQIERLFSLNPEMPTSAVLSALRANYHGQALPSTNGFVREVGRICNEIRAEEKKAMVGRHLAKPATPAPRSSKREGLGSAVPPAKVAAAAEAAIPAIGISASQRTHPLEIFDGKFGGTVFKHGAPIRAFFNAVERHLDDRALKDLAAQVQADAESCAKLIVLHPKDLKILEAALALP